MATNVDRRIHRSADARDILIALEGAIGLLALAGGALLILGRDGHLLGMAPGRLAGSPFGDWLLPGVLLAVLVGAGYLVTVLAETLRSPAAWLLSLVAGAGLIAFEAVQLAWIGFHPLQAICGFLGLVVMALAWQSRRLPGRRQGE